MRLAANLQIMRKMLLLLSLALVSLTVIGCAGLAYSPAEQVPEMPGSKGPLELVYDTPGQGRIEQPGQPGGSPEGGPSGDLDSYYRSQDASGNPTAELDTPEKAAVPEERQIPHGSIALFNRVSLGKNEQQLPTGQGTIVWETGGRGILRHIPANDSYELVKKIVTTSWAPSTIYPLTVGGRLFSIRDWGMDWTSKKKRFGIDELDPITGAQISTTDVKAEWFTILGDRLYFQSEIVEDFWGGPATGGHLKVKQLGDRTQQTERKLPVRGFRFHTVGDQLVSMADGQINIHDPETGAVRSSRSLDPALLEGIWPGHRSVFFGEEAIYWAAKLGDPSEISIIRAPLDSEPESVVSFTLDGYETGLVMDEVPGLLMVGVTSPAPPRGLGITQIFLIDLENDSSSEITVDRHIPRGEMAIGGGLQMLRLYPD